MLCCVACNYRLLRREAGCIHLNKKYCGLPIFIEYMFLYPKWQLGLESASGHAVTAGRRILAYPGAPFVLGIKQRKNKGINKNCLPF